MAKSHTYPSHVVQDAARKAGATCLCLWEMKGPPNTMVAWLTCYQLGESICIVETFKDGGWNAFTPCRSIEIPETIADVFNRCGVPVK
jgi:hypothetical protein